MAEETLSQAAIDALLAGNAPPEQPKAESPSEPIPQESPAEQAPQASELEGVGKTELSPAQEVIVEHGEPLPQVDLGAALEPLEGSLASLRSRIDQFEKYVKRIDSLEAVVKSGNSAGSTLDPEIQRRIEALEQSVLSICQLQQEVIPHRDPMLDRIPPLELELAGLKNTVQNISNQLQNALAQLQETVNQMRGALDGLQGTMGYDIQRNFECQYCGSRGYVVGLVKCSECGEEDWWGWWPPEYEDEPVEPVGAYADVWEEPYEDYYYDNEWRE